MKNKNMKNKKILSNNLTNSQNFFLENKAQAGAVFRLMVDAIIGLVILVAILSTLSHFEQQQLALSLREFESFLTSAINSPDGKIIESPVLTFNKGTMYSTRSFEAMTQHPRECFFIQGLSGSIRITDDETVEFLSRTQVKIYAKCETSGGDCPYTCTISFGKKIIN
jgi:hypothetical protein